jgi:hypothetical protein
MLENYTRVRLRTNKYVDEGALKGAIGYVIEVYPNGEYEIEFSNEYGTTLAQIVAQENELQQDEPTLLTKNTATGHTVVETVYLTPPVQQRSKLTRSNKK